MARRSGRRGRQSRSRRVKRNVPRGCIHIKTSFNNTLITVTDTQGNVLRWATAGSVGFRGTRKSTPFAARIATQRVAEEAMSNDGMREVDVFVKGAGPGREAEKAATARFRKSGIGHVHPPRHIAAMEYNSIPFVDPDQES